MLSYTLKSWGARWDSNPNLRGSHPRALSLSYWHAPQFGSADRFRSGDLRRDRPAL